MVVLGTATLERLAGRSSLQGAKAGRHWAAQLERLREYHREHGSLGKRYIEVIRAFNPNYTPHTDDQLAVLSRSIPTLAITWPPLERGRAVW